jgi:PPOX class probable F420-dependent enzyme
MIDFSTALGQRALRLLRMERVVWLTTVGPDGTPQPRPVWFIGEGDSLLVYSEPKAHKIAHLEANPGVAVHFNTDREGSEVTVLTGTARIDRGAPRADQNREYLDKYRQGIADLDMTPEGFANDYSVPVRISLTRLRGS